MQIALTIEQLIEQLSKYDKNDLVVINSKVGVGTISSLEFMSFTEPHAEHIAVNELGNPKYDRGHIVYADANEKHSKPYIKLY